jgi:hypothetical protein
MPGLERFQLLVKEKDPRTGVERELRVGPILQYRAVLEEYAAIINRGVAEGKEKLWREATVVKVGTVQ